MFCLCYFLSSSFFLFNDRLEQRDLGKYKTDLHQIFRCGRHVGVDVQSGIGLASGKGTLSWQPILGMKSATRLPSWDSHSTTDGRMGKYTVNHKKTWQTIFDYSFDYNFSQK